MDFSVIDGVDEFCCPEMKSMWQNDVIGYGSYQYPHLHSPENKTINLRYWDIYPEGSHCHDEAIEFCPFCGEKIVIKKEGHEDR